MGDDHEVEFHEVDTLKSIISTFSSNDCSCD